MPFRVRVEVRIDFNRAANWRTANRPRTARRFIEAFDAALAKIAEDPTRYPLAEESTLVETRYLALRKYPYKLVYTVRGDDIEVVALVHLAQDSSRWLDRLPEES